MEKDERIERQNTDRQKGRGRADAAEMAAILSQGLNIKILVGESSATEALEARVREVLAKLNLRVPLRRLSSASDLALYEPESTPALVINEKAIAAEQLKDKESIKRAITAARGLG